MTLATNLMGVGVPPEQSTRLGVSIASVTANGTLVADATPITQRVSLVTTDTSEVGVILPSTAELGSVWEVYNISSTTATVFPPTGGNIDAGSDNASVDIAQNRGRIFRRVSSTAWKSIYGA
jgi:hypothetical protein